MDVIEPDRDGVAVGLNVALGVKVLEGVRVREGVTELEAEREGVSEDVRDDDAVRDGVLEGEGGWKVTINKIETVELIVPAVL